MANIGTPNHLETSAGRDSSSSNSREEDEKKQVHGHTNAAVAVAAAVAAGGNDDKMQLAGYELDTAPSGSSSVVNKKNGHLRLGSDDAGGGGGDANDPGRIASRGPDASEDAGSVGEGDANSAHYKVYRRRWFGLLQLTLLNIIVSWDVS